MTRSKKPLAGAVVITAHLPRDVGLEVQRLAKQDSISVSACAARLLEEALRIDVEHRHEALLEAAVERAIGRQLGRIADMSFRSALTSDEARRLVLHMLIGAEGEAAARAIRSEAHSAAWQRLSEPPPTAPKKVQAA